MRKLLSKYLCLLLFVVVVSLNFIYMHLCVYGVSPRLIDYVRIYSSCLLDVSIFLGSFLIVTCGSTRLSCWFTYLLSLIICIPNIVYSRFFQNYISIDCFSVVNEFGISFYLQYIRDAFRLTDIILIFLFCSFWIVQRRVFQIEVKNSAKFVGSIFAFIVFLYSVISFVKCNTISPIQLYNNFSKELSLHPKQTISENGIVVPALYGLIQDRRSINISDQDREYISSHYFSEDDVAIHTNLKKKNLIIILVESLLSCVSDLSIQGEEVTPFLNSLKKYDCTYYNGNMKSNVSIGESSDGQFIYLTGLLPLEDVYTINIAKNYALPAIPRLLRDIYGYKTYMTIPTAPDCWQQQKMCLSYGIDSLYSSYNYEPGNTRVSDSIVFLLAKQHQIAEQSPFFEMILTVSMHSPYNECDFQLLSESDIYPQEYLNYLSICHYTDKQIESYFDWLKESGLLNNSVIVIVADHPAHDYFLRMNKSDIKNMETPLYIVDVDNDFSTYPRPIVDQIDVFPSLVDYLGINSRWIGVGKNIFSIEYTNENSLEKEREMSSKIIKSNYFKDYLINRETL